MPRPLQLVTIVAFLGYYPAALHGQTTGACHTADPLSDELLAYVRTIVTSSDSSMVRLRTGVGLPAIDSSQVVLLRNATDAATCEEARDSFIRGFKTDTLHVPTVYVIKVASNRYVVTDMTQRVGEFGAIDVLDEHFSYVGGIAR